MKWNHSDFNMENHNIIFDGEGKQSVLISIPFEGDVPECVKDKLNEVIGLGMAEWLKCGTLDGLLEGCVPNPFHRINYYIMNWYHIVGISWIRYCFRCGKNLMIMLPDSCYIK